jgi:phosphate transport system substrate-binding protein
MSKQGLWGWPKSAVRSGIVCMLACIFLTIVIETAPSVNDETGAKEPAGEADRKDLGIYSCSDLEPLFLRYHAYYAKAHPDLNLIVSVATNDHAAEALRLSKDLVGKAEIVGMTRSLTAEEFKSCVDAGVLPMAHLVAYDALAIVVHASNPTKQITVEQLRAIYRGKIGNWKELGGPDAQIQRFGLYGGRQEGGGFEEHVVGRFEQARDVEIIHERETMVERIRQSPLGIGYVRAQMFLEMKDFPKEVKVLEVKGVALTRESVRSGSYVIAWPVFLYTNGYPALGSDLHRVVTLHLSKEGQSLVEASGYCAVTSYR